MSKQYGLIIPGKNAVVIQAPGKRAAIFDEDSDSDESNSAKPVYKAPPVKKQIKLEQEKALEEDPTVYQYDEVYDDMEKQRNEAKLLKKGPDRKPKYISNLLKAAERRKRENERRIDRQVQKEREAEGDEFKDKESFVTPSYQKKLEEMKLLEEQEKREEYLEAIGDVRQQGNLDGFYRHLYEQKLNTEEKKVKLEPEEVKSKDEVCEAVEPKSDKITKKDNKNRRYRKREESDSEDEDTDIKKEPLASNIDADSDFSIDSSDSEEDNSNKVEKDNNTKDKGEKLPKENADESKKEESIVDVKEGKPDVQTDVPKVEEKIQEPVKKKPKVDIYKKRTVGTVFEEARQRYFERKALRYTA